MMEGRQGDYELYIREKKKLREKKIDEKIERVIAAISDILCEHLHKTQENDREKSVEKFDSLLVEENEEKLECDSEKKEENYLREKEREIESIFVTSKESSIDTKISSSISNAIRVTPVSLSPLKIVDEIPKEEACKKTNAEVLPKEKRSASTELLEQNIRKSQNTTIIPSSKLFCVVKCWDSFNIIQLTNISSLCHEENKVKEGEYSARVDRNCELGKNNYVQEMQQEVNHSNPSNGLGNFPIVKVAYDEFFRLIFDPGGIGVRNSRSNFLEEGENDDNLLWACCPVLITLNLF